MIYSRCQQCTAQLPPGTLDDLCPFCVEDSTPKEMFGSTLGNCEVYEEIGRGGMGIVWRGRQRTLDREVAIKTLPGGDLAGAEARARFRTEAQAVARLKHPGIVTVYEVGEEDGMPYFVMELVHGRTLSALVAEQPLPVQTAARLLRETALAVSHAHAQGVLHRDLKPSNIIVEHAAAGGKARVMDFGLAKLTDVDSSVTLSRSAAGSPAYMSPEQARGQECTTLTDIYGLGAVLYASLTGRAPHAGESLATIMEQVEREEPVATRRLNSSVPADLDTICFKCLEKSPTRRYATAQELADDLERFLNGEPVHARPVGMVQKAFRWAKRKPWHAVAAMLAFSMLAGIILSLAWQARTEKLHQEEVSLLLMNSQLSEARTILKLQAADSRPRAEAIVSKIMAGNPLPKVREEARDIALAALALPSASLKFCEGPDVVMTDWTLLAGDLPRGRWALANFHGRVSLRALDSKAEQSAFDTAPRKITALIAFSPGGRWLSIRHGEELGIWDTTPGAAQPLAFVAKAWPDGTQFNIGSVVFTPDDKAVLWPDGDALVATSLPDGRELTRWNGVHSHCLAFDPGGKFFVVGPHNNQTAELRNWPTGEVLQTFASVFPKVLQSMAVAANTGWVAGGDFAGRITVWKPDASVEPMELRGHSHTIRAMGFAHDGRHLASIGDEGALCLWDCSTGERVVSVNIEAGIPSFSPTMEHIGMGCSGGRVATVQPVLSQALHRFQAVPLTRQWQTVVVHPKGHSLACLVADGFATYSLPEGQFIRSFTQSQVHTLKYEADGNAIVASGREIYRHSLTDNSPPMQLYPSVKFSWDSLQSTADGQWMAATDAAQSRFVMWPQKGNAREKHDIFLPSPSPQALSLSPNGAQCAGMERYLPGLRIFDTSNGNILKEFDLPTFHVLLWSPDGRFLAINGPTNALWETQTWQKRDLPELKPTLIPAGAIRFFHPDASGKCTAMALTEDSHLISIISLTTHKRLATLESPPKLPIYEIAITPDNRYLLAATALGQIHLWDLASIRARLRSFQRLETDWQF